MTTPRAATPAPRPRRSARRQFASTILVLEAFLVFFAALTAYGLQVAPAGTVWGLGGALALCLVLVSGMLRRPLGYVLGSVLQVPLLAGSLVIPLMLVVAVIFVVLWVMALRLGGRIDRERAEREAAGPAPAGA